MKKQKVESRKYYLDIPIYDQGGYVVFTNNTKDYLKKIGKYEAGHDDCGAAFTLQGKEKDDYVFYTILPFNATIDDTVHEADHITNLIGARVGILPTEDLEDEAHAYLIAWIHGKLREFKKRANSSR